MTEVDQILDCQWLWGHKRELFKFLLNMNNRKKKFGNPKVSQMDTYLYDIDSGIPFIFKPQKFQFLLSAM